MPELRPLREAARSSVEAPITGTERIPGATERSLPRGALERLARAGAPGGR